MKEWESGGREEGLEMEGKGRMRGHCILTNMSHDLRDSELGMRIRKKRTSILPVIL